MAKGNRKKELGASWIKEAKVISLHEGREVFESSLEASLDLPKANEILYSRFCSFAHDDMFRAGVFQNAAVHRPWGVYDAND